MPARISATVAARAAVALSLAAVVGCGGASPGAPQPASDPLATASLEIVPALSLRPGGVPPQGAGARRLPPAWAISFDVQLQAQSSLELRLGARRARLVLSRSAGSSATLRDGGRTFVLSDRAGWLGGGSRHVEMTNGRLAIDGRPLPLARVRGARLGFRVTRGRAQISALIISDSADRATLLFHRVAELHARIPAHRFPEGADRADDLYYSSGWTDGFWAGALWQAAAIEPAGGMFASWALAATEQHLGQEHADTHDVGLMYGQSSLAAWRALCRGIPGPPALCSRLKRSTLAAADELITLAASNPGAGTIPTDSRSPSADTIVDSMMNIGILNWAGRLTHIGRYAALASHQAHVIAPLLVRSDGSTAQSVHFSRTTGRVLFVHSHQGLSDSSTWSRGESWALYGFAQTAAELRDPALMSVALNIAAYVSGHLPAGQIPRWDYAAASGAPLDASAGLIAAAGLARLAAACGHLPGSCDSPQRWGALSRTMLAAAVDKASARPPLGLLTGQALDERDRGCWCNRGELIFGLSYGLEALRLQRDSHG